MPIRMRRKSCGMEKVENLYCTAHAQHVMPRCLDHAVESGAANCIQVFATSACVRSRHDRRRLRIVEETSWRLDRWGHERRALRHLQPLDGRAGPPGDRPLRPCRAVAGAAACPRLVRYESIRPAELCEYCAGIAPIAPSLRGVLQSLTRIQPSFLRCSAQRLRVRRSHQKES